MKKIISKLSYFIVFIFLHDFFIATLLITESIFFDFYPSIHIKRSRDHELLIKAKACWSTNRVMQGAIEMYNMDNPVMIDELDIDPLLKHGYLKVDPRLNHEKNQCVYEGYNLSGGGQIRCQTHGAVGEEPSQQEIEAYEASKRRKQTIIKIATIMLFAAISYFI